MRRSVALAAPLNLLLIGSGFSWLALASPTAAASPNPTTGSLAVNVVDNSVDSSSYPTVAVNLSIFDKATGRPERAPETALGTGNVSLSPAGQVSAVTASTADIPAAYVLDIDTSASMAEHGSMARAKALALAFIAHLGANDYVRLRTFDVATNASLNWLNGNDPALVTAISKVTNKAKASTNLTDAFRQAVYWANTGLPPGVERREIVMITDADITTNDLPKDPAKVNDLIKSAPPIFVVGLLPLPSNSAGKTMNGELSSLGTDTEGNYKTASATTDAATQAPSLFQEAWASTKSTWQVTFSTDPVPADAQVNEELTIHDAQGATGTATTTYNSAGLFTKTTLSVDLPDGATVTHDQTVTVSVGGYTTWTGGYELQLFVDCDPRPQAAHCSPAESPEVSGGQTGSLVWSLSVASMAQGSHVAYARLAVTHDGKQYFSTTTLSFTRSGTTWNPGAVILTFGIGVAFIGAFSIAARRRGRRTHQRRAQ